MANEIFSPFGARVTGIMGADFAAKLQVYIVRDVDIRYLAIGDFVTLEGRVRQDGDRSWYTVCSRTGLYEDILGVVAGFEPTPTTLDRTDRQLNEQRLVYVYDYPYVEFEIQADGSLSSSAVGKNANIAYYPAEAGGKFFKSGSAIDVTSVDVASAQVRIVGFAASSGPSDNFPIMRCIVNKHIFKQTFGT
jgi:hypothetical protein